MGPDETVAAELERSANRAVSLGGMAAAAAFLGDRSILDAHPARRAQRSLAAAQAKAGAGSFEDAYNLLAFAQSGPLVEAELARVDLLRAQISYNSIHGNQALPLMLAAAKRFEPLDGAVARGTYLDALSAALFAGRLAPGPDPGMRQVAEAARAAPQSDAPSKADLLLKGMAILYTDGYAASAGPLQRAIQGCVPPSGGSWSSPCAGQRVVLTMP